MDMREKETATYALGLGSKKAGRFSNGDQQAVTWRGKSECRGSGKETVYSTPRMGVGNEQRGRPQMPQTTRHMAFYQAFTQHPFSFF